MCILNTRFKRHHLIGDDPAAVTLELRGHERAVRVLVAQGRRGELEATRAAVLRLLDGRLAPHSAPQNRAQQHRRHHARCHRVPSLAGMLGFVGICRH